MEVQRQLILTQLVCCTGIMVAVILKGYGNVLLTGRHALCNEVTSISPNPRPLGSQDLTVFENSAFAYRVKMNLEWIIVGSTSKR